MILEGIVLILVYFITKYLFRFGFLFLVAKGISYQTKKIKEDLKK